MPLLKVMVILGGVALLAGFALLAQKLADRTHKPPQVVQPIQEVGRVSSMTALEGGVAILVETGGEGQSLLFYDGRGRLVNRVSFQRPAP